MPSSSPGPRQILGARLVFWYVLLEGPGAYPGYTVIASAPDAAGQPRAGPGAPLYPLLTGLRQLRRQP